MVFCFFITQKQESPSEAKGDPGQITFLAVLCADGHYFFLIRLPPVLTCHTTRMGLATKTDE